MRHVLGMKPLVFISSAMALVGCSYVPGLPPENQVSLAEIVDRVQCELFSAVDSHKIQKPWLIGDQTFKKGWAAAYTLTLKTEDKVAVSLGTDMLRPPGLLTIALGGGASEKAVETGDISFKLKLSELVQIGCPVNRADGKSGRFFASSTGVRDWFDRVMTAIDKTDGVQVPDSFGQQLEFYVQVDGSGKGSWTFTREKPVFGATAYRLQTYILKVAFSPRPGAPESQPVHITNWQSGRDTFAVGPAQPKIMGQPMTGEDTSATPTAKRKTGKSLVRKPPVIKRFTPVESGTATILNNQLNQLQNNQSDRTNR